MKKIIITLIVLLFAVAPAMATVPFDGSATPDPLTADSADPTQGEGDEAVEILKPSNSVYGNIMSSPNQFAAITIHQNGTYEYATSSADTKIYRNPRTDTNVGTSTFETTLSASDTTDMDGWKAL